MTGIIKLRFDNSNAVVSASVMDIKTEEDSNELKDISIDIKENNFDIKDNHETNFNEIRDESDFEFKSFCTADFNNGNFAEKDKFLADSLNILSDDLFSLFGSCELSDFNVILKTGESLPCHQFMLQARCPNILSNVLRSGASNSLDFTQYSSQATRAFFKFIYSGKIDFMYSLPREDKSDLFVLSKKYKLEFLENFLLESFRNDSFHVYSQSTCSPPQSPSSAFPDSNQGSEGCVVDKDSRFSPLQHSSHEKKEDIRLSFANLAEVVNKLSSTSGLNTSKNISQKNFPPIADESAYDIFKDEIKSPCNSSLLSPGFQSKRKLDYTNIEKENKKVCSENISDNKQNSPEIVLIDSDSNEECLSMPIRSSENISNVKTSFKKFGNKETENEDVLECSSSSSDFNFIDFFSKVEEVPTESMEISPLKTASHSKTSNLVNSSPHVIQDFPPNQDRSIDKYFEASFPEVNDKTVILEQFSQQKALATPPVNKNILKKVLTPLQEIIISEATPKPDYDVMITPELKVELRKYGIKPDLDPRKARSLLRYIYEQVHPIRAELPKYSKEPVPSTSKARTPSPVIINDDDDDDDCLFVPQSDERSNSDNQYTYEERLYNQSFSEETEVFPRRNLKKSIIAFIRSDSDLFSNVILFRPLLLNRFYRAVREHGIQCTIHELMDVLDDLSISFHVERPGYNLVDRVVNNNVERKEYNQVKRRNKKQLDAKKKQKTS